MSNDQLLGLEERHRELEDWRRAIAGLPDAEAARACQSCYVRFDQKGCACGSNDWALLSVVLILIKIRIDDLHTRAKSRTDLQVA